jgi:hypothetical protein
VQTAAAMIPNLRIEQTSTGSPRDAFQEVDLLPDPTNSSSPTSFKDDSYAITLDRTAGVVHILGKKPAPYGQRRGEHAIPLSRVLSLSK